MHVGLTLPLTGLLILQISGLPGLPGLPSGKDAAKAALKRLRDRPAPPLDSLPPAWKPHFRLALENQFVQAALPGFVPGPVGLRVASDPRSLRVRVDSDSGTVSVAPEMGGITIGQATRLPLEKFTTELTQRNFGRFWRNRAREGLASSVAAAATPATTAGGLSFQFPSPLPKRVQGLLGPGSPALNVYGSESIRLSGQSDWTNQQVGLLGQRRSLFPSLDLQQDLDIRLEGQLSDRVKVNLLQNSANQIPLENRIAINYKGDEDDMIQALDLGNTNLSLPGTQYVSYSGKNEGLFGAKIASRLGPLDFTVLASKQEGRSERSSYAGGSSKQEQHIEDRNYSRGQYFFLYDPNGPSGLTVQDIPDSSIRLYLDEGATVNQVNTTRGRAFVDPNTARFGPPSGAVGDTTPAVRGTFKLLIQGSDKDYQILSDVYGPQFKVIRLNRPLTSDQQLNAKLAVTYQYGPISSPVLVGGLSVFDTDTIPATTMKLLRAPLDLMPADTTLNSRDFLPGTPFLATRELELRNFYSLNGQRIDPNSFRMTIRQGDDSPPVVSIDAGGPEKVPYLELTGLDNFDETSGFVDFGQRGHDGRVDGTAPTSNFRSFVDFENGVLFLPDVRPFAPRLAGPAAKPFDLFVSSNLFRRDTLVGPPDAPNAANPAIYDRRNLLSIDRLYTIDVEFTAARGGNEIILGRSNIIEGSEVVTINNQRLQVDRDYRIDYDLGRITLIRQLGPSDQLNIDYSYAPLFMSAGRTLVGSAFRLEGLDKNLAGAFLYESKGAQDLRPRLGEEPSQVLIGDVNGEWRFKPSWITHLVDGLPGIRTTAASEFNVQAEVGASFPNPNTQNEVFVDDMEATRDAASLSMSPERWRATSIPLRQGLQNVEDSGVPSPQAPTEVRWFTPLNAVKERDLKPSLDNAQGAQNSRTVLAFSLPRRPAPHAGDTQPLWAGLTHVLDPVGLDLSRAQFIELWVNDFRDFHDPGIPVPRVRGRNVKIHVDLGAVSEDQRRAPNVDPNGRLDTEDLQPRDNQLTVTDANNEDTGFDNKVSGTETPAVVPDLISANPSFDGRNDPEGDDFDRPNDAFKDLDPRKWRRANGSEDNKNFIPIPDTEDLNLNNALDEAQNYFEYTIDLGDTSATARYLVTDIFRSFVTYANDGASVPPDNGWRRYRIPIQDSLRVRFGSPDLALARHVRVWIEGVVETDPPPLSADDGRPFLMLGGLDVVGSRWFATDLDAAQVSGGTTLTLNAVNTLDNADIYVPPFDPGSTVSGNQELSRREQSIALEFTSLAQADTLEAYRVSSLEEDYSRYGKLRWYVAGFDVRGYDALVDSLDAYVRFASDERGFNYYEIRRRLPPSSSPGSINWQEVNLTLTDISNLKLRPDFPKTGDILYRAPGPNPNEEYVIKGRPSFTRLRRISFGVINRAGRVFPSGQLWLDEIRATDVARDAGRAQRVQVNGRMSNLLNYGFNWNGRDENFQSVGEARGSGSATDGMSLNTALDLHRFFEATGIVLPMRFDYTTSKASPRFTAGDDVVRTGALAEASETKNTSRSFGVSYNRTWSPRSNPFLLYTLGGLSGNFGHGMATSRNPTLVDTSKSMTYNVNYTIAPRRLLQMEVPGTKLKFHPLPERVYWNYQLNTNESRTYDRQRDSTGSLALRNFTKGRTATLVFGTESRPFDLLGHSFQATRNLTLPEQLREQIGFMNLGRVVTWNQRFDARYAVTRLGSWVKPSLSWVSTYRQNNGPELSPDLGTRSIANSQSLTGTWDLPFDKLVTRTAVVPAGRDTVKRPAVPLWRALLSRMGAIRTDGQIATGSSYSRLSGTPPFLYLVGVSREPGLEADSSGRVRAQFGNRSDQSLDWRMGANTRLDLGFGAYLTSRGSYASNLRTSNDVANRQNRISFPDLDVEYGRVVDVIGLKRLLRNPQLKTAYGRSKTVDFSNSNQPTNLSTSSEWRPLIRLTGDLKDGTRTEMRIERRVTQSENRRLGRSVTTDRYTDVNVSLTRQYSQGQKVSFLGKESIVRSNVSLTLTGVYSRRSGETQQAGFDRPQDEKKDDRLAINGNGSYGFSNNVVGSLELGFQQTRNLVTEIVNRSLRLELRAQFTF